MQPLIHDVEEVSDDLFFVATSPAMRKVRAQVELLAKVNVPVLILGETGSGKEIVARLIHKLSARSQGRFVKVNCAALPGDLLESELFGCEPGVAAPGIRTRQGKFELCHNGTILLDEIAEMPAALQTKLLYAVREKQFSRFGADSLTSADVRILASSNANIEQALAAKQLREDLYYSLSALTVQVPPLRERKEEIPLLFAHFTQLTANRYGLKPRPVSTSVLDLCQNHTWPGNLREFENVVKRYLVMGDEGMQIEELGAKSNGHSHDHQLEPSPACVEATPGGNGLEEDSRNLKHLLRSIKGETERNVISNMLEKTHWNRKEASRLLQISYRSLLYKIQEYQLVPTEAAVRFELQDKQPANGYGRK